MGCRARIRVRAYSFTGPSIGGGLQGPCKSP
jgi:hypothetical protein